MGLIDNDNEFPDTEFQKRYRELRARIEAHPGHIAHKSWNEIGMVWSSMQVNRTHLRGWLTFDSAKFAKVMGGTELQRNQYWGELYRLLANYLASITTLIDMTRNAVKQYSGTQFERDYLARIETIKNSEMHSFVKDLRNYVSHHQVPLLALSLHWTKESGECFSAPLESQAMLSGHQWSAGANRYLQAHEQIDLLATVQDHGELLDTTVYLWYFEQLNVRHSGDIAAVNELITQIRDLTGADKWEEFFKKEHSQPH